MEDRADADWTPHLEPGESLLWTGAAERRKEFDAFTLLIMLMGGGAVLSSLGLLLDIRRDLAEGRRDFGPVMAIFLVIGVCGALWGAWVIAKEWIDRRRRAQRRYALTTRRLLALDHAAGRLCADCALLSPEMEFDLSDDEFPPRLLVFRAAPGASPKPEPLWEDASEPEKVYRLILDIRDGRLS